MHRKARFSSFIIFFFLIDFIHAQNIAYSPILGGATLLCYCKSRTHFGGEAWKRSLSSLSIVSSISL